MNLWNLINNVLIHDMIGVVNLSLHLRLQVFDLHVMTFISTVVNVVHMHEVNLLALLIENMFLVDDLMVFVSVLLSKLSLMKFSHFSSHLLLEFGLLAQMTLCLNSCSNFLLHDELLLLEKSLAIYFMLLDKPGLLSFPLAICMFFTYKSLVFNTMLLLKSKAVEFLFFSCMLLSNHSLALGFFNSEFLAFSRHLKLLLVKSFLDHALTFLKSFAFSLSDPILLSLFLSNSLQLSSFLSDAFLVSSFPSDTFLLRSLSSDPFLLSSLFSDPLLLSSLSRDLFLFSSLQVSLLTSSFLLFCSSFGGRFFHSLTSKLMLSLGFNLLLASELFLLLALACELLGIMDLMSLSLSEHVLFSICLLTLEVRDLILSDVDL